jgi:hypothetical protein
LGKVHEIMEIIALKTGNFHYMLTELWKDLLSHNAVLHKGLENVGTCMREANAGLWRSWKETGCMGLRVAFSLFLYFVSTESENS